MGLLAALAAFFAHRQVVPGDELFQVRLQVAIGYVELTFQLAESGAARTR